MAAHDERASDNLPHALDPFVGRAYETVEIASLLAIARLFTLTGAGGSGKTRLAGQVVRQSRAAFRHGARWVDLSALSDPALVPHVVAAGCGVTEHASPAALEERLI